MLAFVIFIAGFLVGMLAVAFIPIKEDSSLVRLLLFILGLITGMVTIALALFTSKFSHLPIETN